jgi:iron complex outermembrane receptor protein
VSLDLRALRRFSLSIGARQEWYTEGESQFSPTVSGGFWLSPEWKLRASLSRAFRLPTYTDLYYSDPANQGNPNLRPESAWNYEGGVEWFRGRWRAEATLFHRRERDGIDYVRDSPTARWQATNFQRLRFTGVETSLEARIGSAQWIDVRYTGLRGAREAVAGQLSKYVFNFPEHQGAIGWQASLPGGWFARSRLTVLDRLGRDPYALWDAGVSWRRRAWTPFLQLTNLTGSRYEEIQGVVMPGRGVVGGIEWRGEW